LTKRRVAKAWLFLCINGRWMKCQCLLQVWPDDVLPSLDDGILRRRGFFCFDA
jgi:hypothetical protein